MLANLSASSLESQCAPFAFISSRNSLAMLAWANTACSVAQMVEQSKDFESTILAAAAFGDAELST